MQATSTLHEGNWYLPSSVLTETSQIGTHSQSTYRGTKKRKPSDSGPNNARWRGSETRGHGEGITQQTEEDVERERLSYQKGIRLNKTRRERWAWEQQRTYKRKSGWAEQRAQPEEWLEMGLNTDNGAWLWAILSTLPGGLTAMLHPIYTNISQLPPGYTML